MAISLNGTTGITTPGITNTGAETVVDLTTTGNTILGDASGDTLTVTGGTTTFTQGTANGVAFLNGSKVLTTGSANLTFNGTTLTANTIGAFTLGGTIAGGGNQINNVIIGTTGAAAGNFTTLSATGTATLGTGLASYALGGGSAAAAGLTDKDVTLRAWSVSSGTNDYSGDLILQSGVGTGNGSGKLGSVIIKAGNSGGTSSTLGALTTIGTFSSTGLAVTGTLSATGAISANRARSNTTGDMGLLIAPSDTTIQYGFRIDSNNNNINLDYYTGSAYINRVVLDNAGNLGLGVTPSVFTSTIKALQIGPTSVFRAGDTGYTQATFVGSNVRQASAVNYYIADGFATDYTQQGGGHIWSTVASGSAGASFTFTQAMVLSASGNLGIGTSGESMRLAMTGTVADSTYPLIKGTVRAPYSGGWGSLAPETTIGGYQLFTFRTDNGEVNKSSAIEVYLANNTYGAGQTGMRFITGGYNANNGAEAMRITEAGNVGIGTSLPAFKTEIVGGATTVETTLLQIRSNAGGIGTGTTIALGNSTNAAAGSGRVELAGIRDTASGSSFVIRTADSGGTIQNRVKIDESGNMGIGTSTPQNKLQVKATVRPQLSVSYDGTTGLYLEDSSNSVGKSWKIATSTAVNSQLEFYQSTATSGVPVWEASAAVVFDASGNLLVRTAGKSNIVGLDKTAYAAGVGGTLDLGGNYRSTGDFQTFVRIAAEKTNGTNTDYGYNMGFYVTTNNGSTFGTKAATIISDGTLIVGTTNGSAADGKLQVAATGTGAGAANTKLGFNLVEYDSVNGAGLWLGSMTNENTGVIGSRTATGNIAFQTYNGGWAERMRLSYDGNLGIGSNSPGAKLQIDSGDIRLQGSAPGKILFFSTGNGVSQNATLEVQNDGGTTNTGEFRFSTRNVATTLAERVRITAEGNLGIGNSSPNARLDVRGDTGSSVNAIMRIRGTNATSRTTRLQFEDYAGTIADATIDFKIPTAADASSAVLQMGINGSAALAIDVNSNVKVHGTIGFGEEKAGLKAQVTTNVTSGSAQTIWSASITGNMGAYIMVRGTDASGNWFVDFLSFLSSNTTTLLAGMNGGAPGSRTYAVATNTLTLNPSATQTTVTVSANQIGT